MKPRDILFNHYEKGSRLTDILVRHSEVVRDKALAVCERVPHLKPDKSFVAEAAMVHDIGIYQTHTPKIGCHGRHPYIRHGVIGRQLLEQYGYKAHALVCERHVGVGLTMVDIEDRQLPLPRRDMLPTTIEEIIICYADKFFSKTRGVEPHPLEKVVTGLERYGPDKVERFMQWHNLLAG
ncbi:MAG: HDIG domain-containing protein [Desulfobacteraceae bacterium]|jgi:uncharacterized protein